MPACPVCLIEVASDVLEWHVNAHFEGEGAGAGAGAGGGGGAGRWKECTFPVRLSHCPLIRPAHGALPCLRPAAVVGSTAGLPV